MDTNEKIIGILIVLLERCWMWGQDTLEEQAIMKVNQNKNVAVYLVNIYWVWFVRQNFNFIGLIGHISLSPIVEDLCLQMGLRERKLLNWEVQVSK